MANVVVLGIALAWFWLIPSTQAVISRDGPSPSIWLRTAGYQDKPLPSVWLTTKPMKTRPIYFEYNVVFKPAEFERVWQIARNADCLQNVQSGVPFETVLMSGRIRSGGEVMNCYLSPKSACVLLERLRSTRYLIGADSKVDGISSFEERLTC
jgi:hypothetical protein